MKRKQELIEYLNMALGNVKKELTSDRTQKENWYLHQTIGAFEYVLEMVEDGE